jgi:hypothetical protein
MSLPAPLAREWLAAALETLIAARGEETFLTAPLLLPDDSWFPDRWSPDASGVARLAKRLLAYAGLGELAVSIETFETERQIEQVGLDGRASKWTHDGAAAWFAGIERNTCLFGVEISKLDDPLGLVAAMAHEIGHAYRAVHHLVRPERDLEERLTDVTTIYLGFGVLTTAAAARYTTRSHGNLGSSYAHSRQGYLAYDDMAFLLALQLAVRGYPWAAVKRYIAQLPANQAAVAREAVRALDRARTADLLGILELPAPLASPFGGGQSWWKRLFGL